MKIQRPQIDEIVPQTANLTTDLYLQDDLLPTSVIWKSLTYLRIKIKQDIVFDYPSKHGIQKLANAAEKIFADCIFLLDENRLLFEQNNEKIT